MTEQPHPIPPRILDQAGRVALDLACRKCGLNLRAMLPTERCPQCGLSVSQSVQETLDAEGRVQTDIACLNCGYNLRSLAIDGKCPECGRPVTHSVRGNLLQFADPRWVTGLVSGTTLVLAGGVGGAVTIACGFLGGGVFDPSGTGLSTMIGALCLAVTVIGVFAAPLTGLVGLMRLTAPEPRFSLQPEGPSARRVCRCSTVAAVLLVGACVVVVALGGRVSPHWAGVSLLMATLIVVLGALPVSLLRHLATLFRRVPDSGHGEMTRGLSIGILVSDGIIAISFVTGLFISRVGTLPGIALIGMLILAGCGLGVLGALYYARADFANAAELAKSRAGIAAVGQTADDPRVN